VSGSIDAVNAALNVSWDNQLSALKAPKMLDLNSVVLTDTTHACSDFAVRTVASGLAWCVVGDEGLARVPSPIDPCIPVHLIWSDRAEADRWASALVTNPRLRKITLTEMTAELLPKLATMGRHLGPDWSSEPLEPEIAPGELDVLIRRAATQRFCDMAAHSRFVWLLRHPEGPACLPSNLTSMGEMLPVWCERAQAEAHIKGALAETSIVRVALSDFQQRVLIWCAETRRRVAPGYLAGPGVVEFAAWDVKAMLNGQTGDAKAVA
jgi:hypothetical protein